MAAEDIIPPPAPAVRALTCPSCGGSVTLRAAGYTVTVACQYCGSILDVADPQVKLVTEYHQAAAELEIPLGTRGTLEGVEWEAIGYLQRSENGVYGWEEYLLFNPYHGYRWLIKVRGGWSFGELLTVTPEYVTYDKLAVGGQSYGRFFGDGHAQVDYVLGEFYWRVAVGEEVETGDWVRPGWMLSREANAKEVAWSRSRLLPAKEIKAAFGVAPDRWIWPPLPHQTSPHWPFLKTGTKIVLAAAGFLLLLMVFFGGTSWTGAGSFPIAADGREQTARLGPITLPRAWQSVEVRADVPRLENGWVDLDYSLVNRATQQVYEAYGAAERYSGSDSDGPWTEGSRGSSVTIASVPAGTYDLVVEYKGNKWPSGPDYFAQTDGWMSAYNQPEVKVEVRYGTLYVSNLILALILLAIPWIFGLVAHLRFEKARVGESDFAPVSTDDEDDD
jgi:hypothetical protein